MATEYWKAGKDVMTQMETLLGYHPDLALVEDEIAVVFREKAAKKGGKVVLGTSKKAPAMIGVLGDTEYKFILEIAADEWQGLNTKQQLALLDHLLCGCGVEENANTGTMKTFIRTPDVAFYWDELDRHGDWRNRPSSNVDRGDVVELFGASLEEALEN